MRPVLIDTNAYAALKKNDQKIVQIIKYADELVISPIMLGELIAGFHGSNKENQN